MAPARGGLYSTALHLEKGGLVEQGEVAARMNALYAPSQRVLDLNVEIKRLNRLRLRASLTAGPIFAFIALFADRDQTSSRLNETCGSLLIVAALGIRLWALGYIDGNKKRVLVTWGPYRYMRHPLYCGSVLFALGTCLVAGSLMAALLLCLALLWFYLPVLRVEEQFLAARFGDEWDLYCRQTWMLLPKLGTQLPRIEKPFHLRRPWRELGTLLLLPLIAYGTAALIHYLERRHDLPDWFF